VSAVSEKPYQLQYLIYAIRELMSKNLASELPEELLTYLKN
jgi:hypothetical protein